MTQDNTVGFLLFPDQWDELEDLTPEEFRRVMQSLFVFAGADCEMPENMSRLEKSVFKSLKKSIARSMKNYESIRKARVEAGRKGGLQRIENARIRESMQADLSTLHLAQANQAKTTTKTMTTTTAKNKTMTTTNDNHSPVQHPPAKAAAPDEAGVCAAKAPKGCTAAPEGDVSHAQEKPALSKAAVQEHFEALWQLYPSKRGKNQVSERAKRALMAVSVEDMRTAIARYKAEVENAHFDRAWLNGSTWFGGRYEDYLGDNYTPQPAVSHTPKTSRRARECAVSADEAERRSNYFRSREE